MVALRKVDAEGAKQVQGGLVLDELGDGLLAELVGDLDERGDDHLIQPAADEAADELTVDLEIVEGQVLEVGEGAVAGAEVVEGERASQSFEVFGEGAGAWHVDDGGGLGDLDDQTPRLVEPRQVRLDECKQRGVTDGRAGQVHLELHGAATSLADFEQLECLGDHPPVDLGDQPGALCGGQELAGQDQGAVGCAHPQEQLEPVGPAGTQVEDRLGVQHEQVLSQGFPDALDPGVAVPQVVLAGLSGRAEGVTIAAGVLRLVHRDVGVHEQFLSGPGPVLVEEGQPDAGGDADRAPVVDDEHFGAHCFEQPVHHGLGVIGRDPGQHSGELVAAQPPDDVVRAQPGGEQARNLDQYLVTGGVAAAVVDVLEAVQVEHDDGARPAGVEAGPDGPVDLVLQVPTVRQAGERVVGGQVHQLTAGLAHLSAGPIQRACGAADLVLHVIERSGHGADLVPCADGDAGGDGAGAGGVQVAAPESAHRPGQLGQSAGREPGRGVSHLDRAVRDHAGQDQPDGDGENGDDDEDVLQDGDKRRVGVRDLGDGDRVAGAVEHDHGEHRPAQLEMQAPGYPGGAGSAPVTPGAPGVEHRAGVGQREPEQHSR